MQAVILAGGKGRRLAPYTTVFPKPMMPVGERPIMEILIRQLEHYGCREIIIAVGHLAELIMAFFGRGEKLGVTIRYSIEEEPLGTAGPLAFIDELEEDFLVMNGDVLTTLNFQDFYDHHQRHGSAATIGTHRRVTRIDLGIVHLDGDCDIIGYTEKPELSHEVSMGVYCFNRSALRWIPRGMYMDFPDLVLTLIREGCRVMAYRFNGFWLDIGRPDDYQRAVEEWAAGSHRFLPIEKEP
jgi:NDP-sugar pyrophosphorylase family protein